MIEAGTLKTGDFIKRTLMGTYASIGEVHEVLTVLDRNHIMYRRNNGTIAKICPYRGHWELAKNIYIGGE